MSAESSPVQGSNTTEEGTRSRQEDLNKWCEWFMGNICHEPTSAWDRLSRWAPTSGATTTTTSLEVKLAIREDEGTSTRLPEAELDVRQDQAGAGAEDAPEGGFGSEQEPQLSEADGEGSSDEEGDQPGPSRKRKAEESALNSEGKKPKGSPPPAVLSPRKRKHREEADLGTVASNKRLREAYGLEASDCTTSDSTDVDSLAGDMDANDVVVSSVRVPRRRAVFNWRTDHLKEPGYTRGSLSKFRQALRRIKREDEGLEAGSSVQERPSCRRQNAAPKPAQEEQPSAPRREPTRRQPGRKASAKVCYAESD